MTRPTTLCRLHDTTHWSSKLCDYNDKVVSGSLNLTMLH